MQLSSVDAAPRRPIVFLPRRMRSFTCQAFALPSNNGHVEQRIFARAAQAPIKGAGVRARGKHAGGDSVRGEVAVRRNRLPGIMR